MSDQKMATASLLIDNEHVRVTRFDFAPEAQTGLASS